MKNGLPGAAAFQVDVQMDFLFAAAFFDHDFLQDCGDQGGMDAVPEGECPLQGGTDFTELRRRPPFLFRFPPKGLQPFLQSLCLLVEAVVALLELRHGDDALDAHLQQAVFFCPEGGQVLLHAADILGIVVFVGDGLENGHYRVYNGLFVLRQLVKNIRHDPVQLRRPELRRGAGRPAFISVDTTLPGLLFTLGAFQQLTVEAGAVFLTDDLAAVRISVVEFRPALMGHHLFTASLVEGVGPVP